MRFTFGAKFYCISLAQAAQLVKLRTSVLDAWIDCETVVVCGKVLSCALARMCRHPAAG
jgi:hypothetical protein